MLVKENRKQKGIKDERKKLNFPSKSENLVLVEKLIDEICERHYIDEDCYGNLMVSITEAVNNAIQHGNKFDPEKLVEITYEADLANHILHFTVEDEGEGFDYHNLPDPTAPENIEKINGRGIYLMRNLADSIGFSKNGSIVELNFKTSAN